MDIRTPYIRTPYIRTPSIKAQSVGASLVTGATKDVIATPVIALTGNSVTITCATTGATIYYTLDGSTPTSSSTQYSSAFSLDSSCTIKAIAIKGGKSSGIAEEEYVKPIIYLTQWQLMGNSEVHNLPYTDIPQGYKKCKYIESHGTEYIDLGYKNLYSYELKAQLVEAKSTFCIMLANGGSAGQYIGFTADSKWTLGSTFVFNTDNSSPAVVQVTFSASEVEATINNENISRSGSSANSNFRLFTHTTVSTTYNSKAKLWYLKAYDGDTLVHHWIPCLDDNDVPCLYDLVGGQTYYNSGEGTLSYEIESQPAEIWSCGEYSAVDGKYHILVQPLGGSIVDIALDEPLRKVNAVADKIEFADGVAILTRSIASDDMGTYVWTIQETSSAGNYRYRSASIRTVVKYPSSSSVLANILTSIYNTITANQAYSAQLEGIGVDNGGSIYVFDSNYNRADALNDFRTHIQGVKNIYELETPTTEIIQVPQIEEADSYSCVISQGGKAVSWSSFETE